MAMVLGYNQEEEKHLVRIGFKPSPTLAFVQLSTFQETLLTNAHEDQGV